MRYGRAIAVAGLVTGLVGMAPRVGLPGVAQTGESHQVEEDRVLQQCRQDLQNKRNEAAVQSCNRAFAIFQQAKDRRGKMLALDSLGHAYWSLSQYDKAVSYYQQALQQASPFFQQVKFQEVKDDHGAAKAFTNLSNNFASLSQQDKAVSYSQKALFLYQQIEDRNGEALTLGSLGGLYLFKQQYEKAIAYYQQALPILRQIKDRNREATVLSNMGTAYWLLSQYGQAIDHGQQALIIYQQIKDRHGEARVLVNIATVYQSLSQDDKAITAYQQALPFFQQSQDRIAEASLLSNLGSAYQALSQYDKAIDSRQRSLAIYRQFKAHIAEAGVLNDLGNSYGNVLKYDQAIDSYQQALSIFQQFKSYTGEAVALSNLGITYQTLSKYDQAIASYQQALPIFRRFKHRQNEAMVLTRLGSVFQQQGQSDLAILSYKQSINIRQTIRQDIKNLSRETQEIYTGSIAGTYRALADLLLNQGRIREAQEILELLKVQEVSSYGKRKNLNALAVQLTFHPIETQVFQAFEQTIATRSLSLETSTALAQPLIQNRDRITQASNGTPGTIGNPQAILSANPNSLLIQNLVVGDKLWVIWTNASGKTTAIVVPNVNPKQLTTTVEQFRQQIGSPRSDLTQLKATSKQLYNWLIPPQLQAELSKNPQQHLIFSLDHVTRYVPVAALFDGNQYLAQRYHLSNLITTASDTRDRLVSQGQTPTILALGTSKAFPGFNALPNVPAELHAIVREGDDTGIYPGKIRLDATFTADSLRNNRTPFRVLHIATHGSFNPKSITSSFLLLGDGNPLPITDIATLTNLNTTHLVVLSACETGLSGSAQDGTEISGISGYFLYRGAKSVMASLWNVNDASTALMMQQFYKHLAQGMTKAEALQKVQQDFINSKLTAKDAPARSDIPVSVDPGVRTLQTGSTNFAHPYYWAPFILIGNSL